MKRNRKPKSLSADRLFIFAKIDLLHGKQFFHLTLIGASNFRQLGNLGEDLLIFSGSVKNLV